MSTSLKTVSDKQGLGPGSLVHVGEVHQSDTRITVIDYSKGHYEERLLTSVADVLDYRNKESITWVIVEGLADDAIIEPVRKLVANLSWSEGVSIVPLAVTHAPAQRRVKILWQVNC